MSSFIVRTRIITNKMRTRQGRIVKKIIKNGSIESNVKRGQIEWVGC